MFFIVGMNYLPLYGTYHYPDGNGTFLVYGKDNKAKIEVRTTGGGKYSHGISYYS